MTKFIRYEIEFSATGKEDQWYPTVHTRDSEDEIKKLLAAIRKRVGKGAHHRIVKKTVITEIVKED